ncbi:MAG: hypothetical protein R2867_47475 [Caldilineaceae bacterium]
MNLPSGCPFHPRCAFATDQCKQEEPALEEVGYQQYSACWHWREVEAELQQKPLRGRSVPLTAKPSSS